MSSSGTALLTLKDFLGVVFSSSWERWKCCGHTICFTKCQVFCITWSVARGMLGSPDRLLKISQACLQPARNKAHRERSHTDAGWSTFILIVLLCENCSLTKLSWKKSWKTKVRRKRALKCQAHFSRFWFLVIISDYIKFDELHRFVQKRWNAENSDGWNVCANFLSDWCCVLCHCVTKLWTHKQITPVFGRLDLSFFLKKGFAYETLHHKTIIWHESNNNVLFFFHPLVTLFYFCLILNVCSRWDLAQCWHIVRLCTQFLSVR